MKLNIRHAQSWFLPILIALASFSGLFKAITGIRYGPLLIDAALLALIASTIAKNLLKGRFRFGALDLLATAFLLMSILEIFNSNIFSFKTGLEGFRKFSFMVIGILVGRHSVNILTLKRLIIAVLVISSVLSLYGIKQFVRPSRLDFRQIELSSASPITFLMGGHLRSFSTLAGPFHLGIYMVCSLLLLMAIWHHHKQLQIWIIACGIPQLIALGMTVTKSNWAGLFAGGLAIIFLSTKKPLRLFSKLLFLAAVLIIGIFLLLEITQYLPELSTVHSGLRDILNPLQAPTFTFRLQLWKDKVIPLIKERPWFGYGAGSAGEGLAFLFENTSSVYISCHNIFLKIQLELGLVGLMVFLCLILLSLRTIWQVRRRLHDPHLKTVSNWTIAFIAAIFTAGVAGPILDAYPVNFLFWLILGISTRLYRFEVPREVILRPQEISLCPQPR